MKIKTLLQAPLILEELKRLNIDPTTLDPQTRVKLIDGCLVFESEKECFVSAKNPVFEVKIDENTSVKSISLSENSDCGVDFIAMNEEYYLLKEGDIIQKGDEFWMHSIWNKATVRIGDFLTWDTPYRRKIQKPIEEPEYYYLKEGDVIQEGDEVEDSRSVFKWEKTTFIGEEVTRNSLKYRRKIQKNPTL